GGGGATTGLDFQGSASTTATVRFRFSSPLSIYPATYIWRVRPRQQNGYYTAFFWGNDGCFLCWGPQAPGAYYGAHPYPDPPPDGAAHRWEISTDGADYLSAQNVAYNVWHTQALRAWTDGSGQHLEYYWDLPDTARMISVDIPAATAVTLPPSPALTWGDAPWNESNEIMNGVLRGIQIYSALLSLDDIQAEIAAPRSTPAGNANIWYLNLNPTPADISDMSGQNHHPAWVGAARPLLWTGP
ncbi:MAG: hypothetical protein KJ041_02385, partial [Gammaproteobacteria bacterium]|nr:hypothetical protein [Gammaproteobacteria bacterium]